jgi:ABC-type Fe3+/spermidine/putrescine transport system ATPase subunit
LEARVTLEIIDVHKHYGAVAALDGVSLRFAPATYTCVMGASGSGKTTLLRAIAGLETIDRGAIRLDSAAIDPLPPERRPIHTVFQSYALFPHMSVAQNVGFPARLRGITGPALAERVAGLLADVGLGAAGLAERRPDALSGGQRQRVALARALAGEPRLVLLDEPLAALDRPLRAGLRRLLAATQRARGLTFVHVTHDPEEAMALADALVLLADGRVLGVGAPAELYARPPSLTAARLLGELSPLPGARGRWIRPERLRVGLGPARGETPRAAATLVDQRCLGDRWELLVDAGGAQLIVRAAAKLAAEAGASIELTWDAADALELADDAR